MIVSSRNARRTIAARRDAAKAHAKGLHTLASHARLAGLDAATASAVGGALRAKGKGCGVTGQAAVMVRKTDRGVCFVRNARRYSSAEVATLAAAYSPRVERLVNARRQGLAYAGA